MALDATTATMTVISEALFSGDARLTSLEAMNHITGAMEGVSEARIQVLLGMPLIPLSPRGRRGRRVSNISATHSASWCATAFARRT